MPQNEEVLGTFSLNGGPEQPVPQDLIITAIKKTKRSMKYSLGWAIWSLSWLCYYEYAHTSIYVIVWMYVLSMYYLLDALHSWRHFNQVASRRLTYMLVKRLRKEMRSRLHMRLLELTSYIGHLYLFGIIKLPEFAVFARNDEDKKEMAAARKWWVKPITKIKWKEIEHGVEAKHNQEVTGNTR